MKIDQARTLNTGQYVLCPADSGDKPYSGKVANDMHKTSSSYKNILGDEYVWVSVVHPNGHTVTWPSNRLS